MVGPIRGQDRRVATRRLKIGFVLLVGLSSGLITLQSDPSIFVFALAVFAGLVVGCLLVVIALPSDISFRD